MTAHDETQAAAATNIRSWLLEHPEIESVFVCVCDLNGTMRGKRLPIEKSARVA